MRRGLFAIMVVGLVLAAGCSGKRNLSDDSQAGREKSMRNMMAIVVSAHMWHIEHADIFPTDLAQLVIGGQVTPEQLVSPRTGHDPAKLTKEELASLRKSTVDVATLDWGPVARKLEGHTDYAVGFKGVRYNDAVDFVVVLWEKPAGLKDGICVAFGGLPPRFVRFAALPAFFEQCNQIRKEGGLPLIEMRDGLPVEP